jgi:hypothetical protein
MMRPFRSTLTEMGLGVATVGSGDATMGPGPHSLTRPAITPSFVVALANEKEAADEAVSRTTRMRDPLATKYRGLRMGQNPFSRVPFRNSFVPLLKVVRSGSTRYSRSRRGTMRSARRLVARGLCHLSDDYFCSLSADLSTSHSIRALS